MTRGLPDFSAIERSTDDNARPDGETRVLAQLFVDVDTTLGVNGDLEGVARECALLVSVELPERTLVTVSRATSSNASAVRMSMHLSRPIER